MAAGAYFAWIPITPDIIERGALEFPEAASLTAKRGTPVVLDANGRIAACATSFTSIFGVLMDDGQNGTAGQFNNRVYPILEGDQWRVPLLEALAQNLVGQAGGDLGMILDATTGFWYGSTADNGAQARVVQIPKGPTYNIGDTKMPVSVVFHTTKFQVL